MKKQLSILLICILALSAGTLTLAAGPFEHPITDVDKNQNDIQSAWVVAEEDGAVILRNTLTGEKLLRALEIVNGHAREVDLLDYVQELNDMPVLPSVQSDRHLQARDIAVFRYEETAAYVARGTPLKLSADFMGPFSFSGPPVPAGTVTRSFGGSFSLTAPIRSAMMDSTAFSWQDSLESADSFGDFPDTLQVAPGKICYIQFTPYLNVTEGKVYQQTTNATTGTSTHFVCQGTVWGASPKLLDGQFANGRFELMER